MIVSWFSAGVSSFVSAHLMKDKLDKVLYIDIQDHHVDSRRFLKDCQEKLGIEIETLQSKYESVDNVIKQFRFINSAYGAKCTDVLKKRVRKEWERKNKSDIEYVWGFDLTEKHRAERLVESMPEYKHHFPLIDAQLTKNDVHGYAQKLGIKRPIMYDLGYNNNNCVGCVKGGMGYWNKIRVDFPDVFNRMAITEREIGRSCIKGVFLDELEPSRGRMTEEVLEDCSIACQILI